MNGATALTFFLVAATLTTVGTPRNIDHESTSSARKSRHELAASIFGKSGITGLCEQEARKAESRCVSSCGDGAIYTFDPGVCGIGAKCTCVVSVEQPPGL